MRRHRRRDQRRVVELCAEVAAGRVSFHGAVIASGGEQAADELVDPQGLRAGDLDGAIDRRPGNGLGQMRDHMSWRQGAAAVRECSDHFAVRGGLRDAGHEPKNASTGRCVRHAPALTPASCASFPRM